MISNKPIGFSWSWTRRKDIWSLALLSKVGVVHECHIMSRPSFNRAVKTQKWIDQTYPEQRRSPAPSPIPYTHKHVWRVTWILLSALLLTPVGNGPFCACPNTKMIRCWLAHTTGQSGASDPKWPSSCELLCKARGEGRHRKMAAVWVHHVECTAGVCMCLRSVVWGAGGGCCLSVCTLSH